MSKPTDYVDSICNSTITSGHHSRARLREKLWLHPQLSRCTDRADANDWFPDALKLNKHVVLVLPNAMLLICVFYTHMLVDEVLRKHM